VEASTERTTVYVELLEEGVPTWRPTAAESLGKGRYRLLPTDIYDPEDETWQFLPGTVVACEERRLSDGVYLVAVRPG
jgi:hypothetical protein